MDKPFPQLKAALKFGKWSLVKHLGGGGSGQVWLARDSKGGECAIKILIKNKAIAFQRFKDEIKTLHDAKAVSGVVPIVDEHIPEKLGEAQPWYAMPVGERFTDWATKEKNPITVTRAIATIADTFAELHALDIVHRDVKPSNLLIIDKRPFVGDFGLVDFPEKADVTASKEDLGPRWTMAPEVKREGAALKNGKPADVFSLAKTLWIVLTGREKGFDGRYSANGANGLKQWLGAYFLEPLEELLSAATDDDPMGRPDMSTLASGLRYWCDLERRFPERNGLEWKVVLSKLFPVSIPARARWTGIEEIVRVMNLVGSRTALNHLFFPTGGGLDLASARHSTDEPGCIEFTANGLTYLFRPESMTFESFDFDPEWNYFRIDAAKLDPTDVYESHAFEYEEVLRLGDRGYVNRAYWDAAEYGGEPLPKGSKVVSRFFRGAFVIFQKTSVYNRTPGTYDARHNKISADEFRGYIQGVVDRLRKQREKESKKGQA